MRTLSELQAECTRLKHWIKRKRATEVEAFISGFKPGSPNRGNGHLVGAVEFSVRGPVGDTRPVAWVSSWTDDERRAMTHYDESGAVRLNPAFLGRRALLAAQDESAKSQRLACPVPCSSTRWGVTGSSPVAPTAQAVCRTHITRSCRG